METASTPALPLQLVLLGPAQAGKTALLAGLGQIAQTQPELLHGTFTDLQGAFKIRRAHLYEQVTPTVPLPTAYPLRYHPEQGSAFEAVLSELDADVASALLQPRRGEQPQQLPLLDHADAVLVTVDLAQPEEERGHRLIEMGRFLRQLELKRSRHQEVGGLPVYVVLTRGDALAAPGDSLADWIEKLEQSKRQARDRLQAILDSGAPPRPTAFGRVEVNVWATAACHPALGGGAARPEPYGVAELFRQSLTLAARYRESCQSAHRQLVGLLTVSGALTLVLALLAFILFGGVPVAPPSALELKVQSWQKKEGAQSLALRLRGLPGTLRKKEKQLVDFEKDPEFAQLPPHLRELVSGRRQEVQLYIAYLEKLLSGDSPAMARKDADLDKIEQQLKTEFALPQPAWTDTDAGKLREQRLADCRRIREQSKVAEEWYRQQKKLVTDLWTFTQPPLKDQVVNWRRWQDETNALLGQSNTPPLTLLRVPANSLVTQQTILAHERVIQAREEAQEARTTLEALRNITRALGLIDPSEKQTALLVVPRQPTFAPAQAKERLQQIADAYTQYAPEFQLRRVSDLARPVVMLTARTSLDYLLPGAQEIIRQKFDKTTGADVASRWRYIGGWLAESPEELKSWRQLALLLSGLSETPPRDLTLELAGFLRQDSFALTFERFVIDIPDDAQLRIPDESKLILLHKKQSYTFTLTKAGGSHDVQNRVTHYTFEGERVKFAYLPGDELTLEVEFRDEPRRLIWRDPRNSAYAFEALRQPPRLYRHGQQTATEGKIERNITLQVRPSLGLPILPDLLPASP